MSILSSELRSSIRDDNLHDIIPILERLYSSRNPPEKQFLNWRRSDVMMAFSDKVNPLTIERIVSFLERYQKESLFHSSLGTDPEDSDILMDSPTIKMKEPDSTLGLSLTTSLPAGLFRNYYQSTSTVDLTTTNLDRPSQPLAHGNSSYSISPSCSQFMGFQSLSPSSINKRSNLRKYRPKFCSSAPDLVQLQRMDESELSLTPRNSNYSLRPPTSYRHQGHSNSFSQRTPNPTNSLAICPFQFNNSRYTDQFRRWSATSSGYNTASPASVSTSSSCEKLNYLSNNHQDYESPTSRHWRRTDSMGSEDDFHFKYRSLRSLSPDSSITYQPLDQTTVWDTFKANFPQAQQNMQDQLYEYIKNLNADEKMEYFSKNQLKELAQNIIEASDTNQLTSTFFMAISTDLAEILHRIVAKYNTGNEASPVISVIKQLYCILSRPARLLECMEFDPEAYMNNDIDIVKRRICEDDLVPYIMRHLNSDLTIVEEKSQSERADKVQEAKQPSESDFVKIKVISKGAYGIVLLVRYKDTNRKFAMKKISKQRMVQKKLVPQVYAERDILSLAENPFLVSLLCTFSTRRHYCLVMEYVEGGDVASLIDKVGPLPVDMARMYFSEAVLALEYVHNYNIIHRDLKPDNMLITSEGHIKLTDFGLSKIGLVTYTATLLEANIRSRLPENHFKESTVWGTPDYIAPEVILGLEYDKAVDWWSMGVILYEMLAYFKPFRANTVDELFDIITNESCDVTWPDDEDRPPKDAEDLIKKLLIFQPKKRLGSCEQGGIDLVKTHPFFNGLDWNNLLRIKAEFVPQLEGEYDTSYFDRFPCTVLEIYKSRNKSAVYCVNRLLAREERYPGDYESDDEDDETPGEPGTQFTTTSARYSKLLEGEDIVDFGDLTITPSLPDYPKQESKEFTDSPSEKSIPDLLILSDKEDEKSNEDEHRTKQVDENDLVKLLSSPNLTPCNSLFPCNTPTDSEQDLPSLESFLPRTAKSNNIALLSISEPDMSYVTDEYSMSTDLDKVTEHDPPVRYRSHAKTSSPPQPPEKLRNRSSDVSASKSPPKLKRRPHVSRTKPPVVTRDTSPISPPTPGLEICSINVHSKQIEVEKRQNEFGFAVRGIRVYMKNSNKYQTEHLATGIVKGGAADAGGLEEEDLITNINGEEISGYSHSQIAALLAHNKKVLLTIIPLHESSIQQELKKRESIDSIRISKKSKTLSNLFPSKKKKGIFKINFPLPHRTSSASSSSSDKSTYKHNSPTESLPMYPYPAGVSHTRVPSFTSSVSNLTSPVAHGSPVHIMKNYHMKKRPTPVSPLARTPSPSSLYRSTSLNLSQQKDNHLMPPTQQTGVRVTPSKPKTLHPNMRMHHAHSRVGRSRSQTNSDLKDLHHHHASSLDCSLSSAPSHSPVTTPQRMSPEVQPVVNRPRSATTHSKSPQRHSNPCYYSRL